jgi:hypothetical protein
LPFLCFLSKGSRPAESTSSTCRCME